ncbi:MAG TPA: bifunctional riboflavin kinase/FMN adenylyltransferase [Chloroflexi bacterium]|nr:bifunctional riboflavin kinase/FMN adenylyltransferase [Chloroflexota bacterium]
MQHYRSLDQVHLQGVWLTIGSFDGLHLGHQEIIRNLTAEAHQQSASAVVLTFYPHPAEVLRSRDFPFYLTTPDEKAELLVQAGVDVVITHPFDRQVAATSAQEFMTRLHQHLGMRHLKIGHDFALGRDRAGNAQTLSEIGESLGYSVEQIPPFSLDGQIVSSSRIRFLLGAGQVEEAARFLGRNFSINGTVVLGDQRGRSIGFPTANLELWEMRAIPAAGVYACRVGINGIRYDAVTNIGVRPTFEANPVPPRVETHLLDFQDNLYGASIKLEFIARLRGEQRFNSVNELIAQIHRDVAAARQILA